MTLPAFSFSLTLSMPFTFSSIFEPYLCVFFSKAWVCAASVTLRGVARTSLAFITPPWCRWSSAAAACGGWVGGMPPTRRACLAPTRFFPVREHAWAYAHTHSCLGNCSSISLWHAHNWFNFFSFSIIPGSLSSRTPLQTPSPPLWCVVACWVVSECLRARPPACPGVEPTTALLTGSTSTSRAAAPTWWPHLLMALGQSTSAQSVMGEETAVRWEILMEFIECDH